LTVGQSLEHASIPTLNFISRCCERLFLEREFRWLRLRRLQPGSDFSVCLTHDIDFVGIRRHKFDHTMWGFLYRSTVGAMRDLLLRKLSFIGLLKRLKAAATLPFVHLGWAEDF